MLNAHKYVEYIEYVKIYEMVVLKHRKCVLLNVF